jgi:hypothetical protein
VKGDGRSECFVSNPDDKRLAWEIRASDEAEAPVLVVVAYGNALARDAPEGLALAREVARTLDRWREERLTKS